MRYLKLKHDRPDLTTDVKETVTAILNDIQRDGLAAVRAHSERLDGWSPETFRVSKEEQARAAASLEPSLREHIDFAREQVELFARRQRATLMDLEVEIRPGVRLGHRHVPVRAVGSYAPGGRYPMIASALMTIVTPKVAGVDRVVAVAPPTRDGGIHEAQLYAMASSGADEILCVGGVQALGLLAFGAEAFASVDMIVGAGNAYVAEAKRQLFGTVGIDLLAGPTEVLVIADESADAKLVAADLLAQAEHGPSSPAVLVTTSEAFGEAVGVEVDHWLRDWPTRDVTAQAWRECGEVIVCRDREEAADVANRYAPEHLELQTADDDWFTSNLTNYGSLFIGPAATVAYSDKAIGTNHVLPTGRAARYTGGLWVGKFLKTLTFQRVSPNGAGEVARATAAIAEAEHMLGHALTATLRLQGGLAAG